MKRYLLSALFLLGLAGASAPDQTPVTLPDGVVVKNDLPGAPRGNPQSDKAGNTNKTYICHATSAVKNNGYVIVHVGNPAVPAHVSHEHATSNGNGRDNKPRDAAGGTVTTPCGEKVPS